MATTGELELRRKDWERDVKGFALKEFRMKQIPMISRSNAWTNAYYQENGEISNRGTRTGKGLGRGSEFPYGEVDWTEKEATTKKYGREGIIFWEDAQWNNIDVISRTLLRVGRKVARDVDDEITEVITEGGTPTNIHEVAISAGNEWDSGTVANRDPIQNILDAKAKIAEEEYDPDSGMGFIALSPQDYANLIANDKVLNNPTYRAVSNVQNGVVGQILNLNIIVSTSMSPTGALGTDAALVGIMKECATWKENAPLTVATIEDAGKHVKIRAWQYGTTQLTNPKALCLITNTQA